MHQILIEQNNDLSVWESVRIPAQTETNETRLEKKEEKNFLKKLKINFHDSNWIWKVDKVEHYGKSSHVMFQFQIQCSLYNIWKMQISRSDTLFPCFSCHFSSGVTPTLHPLLSLECRCRFSCVLSSQELNSSHSSGTSKSKWMREKKKIF